MAPVGQSLVGRIVGIWEWREWLKGNFQGFDDNNTLMVKPFGKTENSKGRYSVPFCPRNISPENFKKGVGSMVHLPHAHYLYLQVAVAPLSFLSPWQKRGCKGKSAGEQGGKAVQKLLACVPLVGWVFLWVPPAARECGRVVLVGMWPLVHKTWILLGDETRMDIG